LEKQASFFFLDMLSTVCPLFVHRIEQEKKQFLTNLSSRQNGVIEYVAKAVYYSVTEVHSTWNHDCKHELTHRPRSVRFHHSCDVFWCY